MNKLNNFKEYINESKSPHLMIYYGANYPYNYTVIKGNELYSVSFRKDKPFLVKYHGKINREIFKPNGRLVRNPSMGLISNIQKKCIPPFEKQNEEFKTSENMIDPDKLSFMNKLNEKIPEILDNFSKKLKINYLPGKIITIGTSNRDDIKIVVRIENDKIFFEVKPTKGPSYEFNYGFDYRQIDKILNLIKSALNGDPNKGVLPVSKDKYPSDTEEPSTDIKEEDIEPLSVPIKDKPKKRTRSININIIQDVLEDAYIIDDIDLKETSVEELIRRMLLETRSKRKK